MNQETTWVRGAAFANRVAVFLSVPAILLMLVGGSVTWAVNDPGLYRNGFQRYHVAARSGISDTDLLVIGADLRRYFNTGAEPLAVRAPIYGIEQDVFNQREIAHMYDVKHLVRGTYWVAAGAGLWILATLAWAFVARRNQWLRNASRLAIWGGAVTVGAVVGVGIVAIGSFEQLFLLFHQLSFANDLWMLDPRTDYLLILFPGGFWFDATMRVALTSILGALLLISIGGTVLGYLRWRSYGASRAAARLGDTTPGEG